MAVGHYGAKWLIDFMSYRGHEFSHRHYSRDVRQLCLRVVQRIFGLLALSDVHHRSNILEVAFFISYSLGPHVDMLNRTIRHYESMFKIQIRSGLDSAFESLLYAVDVVRMNPLEHQFQCWLSRWIISTNWKCFLRAEKFSGGNMPRETASLA